VKRDQRQQTGLVGEQLAAEHLEARGYQIIARRYRVRAGEIDLVAFRPGLLVFIEVKTRRQTRFGIPAESVHSLKRDRITRAAECFLNGPEARSLQDVRCRFDVIAIIMDDDSPPRLEHLEDAFRPGL